MRRALTKAQVGLSGCEWESGCQEDPPPAEEGTRFPHEKVRVEGLRVYIWAWVEVFLCHGYCLFVQQTGESNDLLMRILTTSSHVLHVVIPSSSSGEEARFHPYSPNRMGTATASLHYFISWLLRLHHAYNQDCRQYTHLPRLIAAFRILSFVSKWNNGIHATTRITPSITKQNSIN